MLLLRQLGGDEDPRNIITDLDDEKEKHSTRSRWSQRIKPTAKAKPRDEQCVSNLTNPPRIEGGNNTGKNGRNRGEGEGEGGRSSHRTHQPLRLGVWSHRGLAGSRSLYAAAAAASAHRRLTADLDFFFFFLHFEGIEWCARVERLALHVRELVGWVGFRVWPTNASGLGQWGGATWIGRRGCAARWKVWSMVVFGSKKCENQTDINGSV